LREPNRHRFWIACVAGLALLLQGLASLAAASASQPSAHLDAFGNVLCITSTDASQSGDGDSVPAKAPNCCTLGCGTSIHAFASPADHVVVVDRLSDRADGPVRASGFVSHVSRDYDPGNPRAPPRAA
jgi:hypothetical protein